ncbi:Flap-structured DNA-binding and RNA-binding protein [Agyrium rufum]|nr:Flap-structured DNA-binding and RNA-binding protein [Agyrium rufum]
MSASHIVGNRNSTPEATQSSLRPPNSRGVNNGHHLRASADMSSFSPSPLSGRHIRPASEVYPGINQSNTDDAADKAAQQWIAEIDQIENTLEEMAEATLDQDFKDELSAIEQWFKVLSEAERTAALYALLQQTTQVQIRFFIQVLKHMAKSHPMSGLLSPANFGERDAMSNRLSDAMNRLSVNEPRSALGRPPSSPGNKRNSALDPSTINAMFPDAAAAIAMRKAEYAQQTGNTTGSNRNSAVMTDRNSLVAPNVSTPETNKETPSKDLNAAWRQGPTEIRPKSSSGAPPMGQFASPAVASAIRSPRPMQLSGDNNLQNTNLTVSNQHNAGELPALSPYPMNASWASMSNTPMVPNFQQAASQADMVANATAMKLAALSTVNNRIALDDVRKYQRRARSNDGGSQMPLSPGMARGTNVLVMNESGQLLNSQPLNPSQLAALQMQQQAAMLSHRSRPNSPGIAMQGGNFGGMGSFASPQNNGYLAAFDTTGGAGAMSMGSFGMGHGHEGYLSDHSEIGRGRSPRGKRGTSKPPEDPTDPSLLQDIPAWLRSLRLHKYTDNLKDLKWQELVDLDDKGLEDRGVNALGARRKMLKVFEQVKEAKTDGKL